MVWCLVNLGNKQCRAICGYLRSYRCFGQALRCIGVPTNGLYAGEKWPPKHGDRDPRPHLGTVSGLTGNAYNGSDFGVMV